jgi:C-terminal processing protease CtpA/Prc
LVGDKLVKVGDLASKTATFGAVIDALHGPPGATRTLLLERDGKRFTITASIVRFGGMTVSEQNDPSVAKAGLQGKHKRHG